MNAGSKLERGSYEKICGEIGGEVGKVTFLTDNVLGKWDLICEGRESGEGKGGEVRMCANCDL